MQRDEHTVKALLGQFDDPAQAGIKQMGIHAPTAQRLANPGT